MKAKRKGKKKLKVSLKWKIFISLLIFITLLLGILWFCQTVFLNRFYKSVKTYEANNAVEYVQKHIDSSKLNVIVANLSNSHDISLTVLDSSCEIICEADARDSSSFFRNFPTDQLYNFYTKALQSDDGRYTEYFSGFGKFPIKKFSSDNVENNTYNNLSDEEIHGAKRETSLIVVQSVIDSDGNKFAVIANSTITPVDSVIQTLRYILICVSVIMLLIALLAALIIAGSLTKPLKNITDKAKILAKGKYDEVEFKGSSVKEIDELSSSLNFTKTELGKIDTLQKELVANISHDLRTPLTLISGYAEVMRDIPGEITDENLQVIIDESNRMTSLVSDVLDISKFNSGVQEMNFENMDLIECIKELIPRYNKLVEKNNYKIILETHNFESAIVYADSTKMLQVLYNLINNAVSYTGEDKTVKISVFQENGTVSVHIIDSGEGIPKEKIEYIWDRYYKFEKNHRRAQVGSGLGLSIVKNILDRHGAKYGVSSKENFGSDFWFSLDTVNEEKTEE